jgi:transposase
MKKLPQIQRLVNCDAIGLDVHREVIVFCRMDRRGREAAKGEFEATKAGLSAFLEEHVGTKKSHVTLEASGSFLWAYEMLVAELGLDRVHVAVSRQIAAIAKSTAKNDENDAWWLAWLTHEGRLPEVDVPGMGMQELRIAVRERIRAVQRRTKAAVQLRSHLASLGEVLPTASLATASAKEFVEGVLERSPEMRAMAMKRCLARMEEAEKEIAMWEDEMWKSAKKLPDVKTLQKRIPGVGKILATTLVAEFADIRRFASPKAAGRYTGLTPADRSSGGKMIHGRITREGSPFLRWALAQAVMHCLRSKRGAGLVVGDWTRAAQRRMGHKGKGRVAAARKLAEAIWRLFHDPESFDLTKPFGARAEAVA